MKMVKKSNELKLKVRSDVAFFDKKLRKVLLNYSKDAPSKLRSAMLYSLFSGGKRIRPLLLFASAEMCGLSRDDVILPAVAIELVHNYSLVHDDLPSMDDDIYRRGKLTVHKKFGEAIAVLVGDALIPLAFEILAKEFKHKSCLDTISLFAEYIGGQGLVAGQVLDMESEKLVKNDISENSKVRKILDEIHINKTAKLIEFSIVVSGLIKGLRRSKLQILHQIGRNVGLLFQITDDLIDFCNEQDKNKLTYPVLYGVEGTRFVIDRIYHSTKKDIIENFNNTEYMLYLLKLIV